MDVGTEKVFLFECMFCAPPVMFTYRLFGENDVL